MGEKISKYRQIEEDLHESNKKFQNLVESSHELIQSIDKNGHFIFVNKAWRGTLGYSKKDLARLTLFDVIHPDCLEYCKKLFKKVVSDENVSDIETKFVTKTGKSVYVEGNASPNLKDGDFVSTLGFNRGFALLFPFFPNKNANQRNAKSINMKSSFTVWTLYI